MAEQDTILVCACLTGVSCRYDGTPSPCVALRALGGGGRIVPFCPEQLGGLPTPRSPSYFVGGDGADVLAGRARLVNREGRDVTDNFMRGAEEALRIARITGASRAILKDASPACGVTCVTIDLKKTRGMGVCATALEQAGIETIAV